MVGYIVVGLLIGETGLGLLHPADVAVLELFTNFALGLIGFLVGAIKIGSAPFLPVQTSLAGKLRSRLLSVEP